MIGALRCLLNLPGRMRFANGTRNWRRSDEKEPILLAPDPLDATRPGAVFGGRVKLLHLSETFRLSPDHFNLLYLVSSGPDSHADLRVKWCKEHGVPFVWNQNGVGYPAWAGKETEKINAPMRKLYRQADFIFFQSEFCRASAKHFLGESRVPGEVLYNPVDLESFHPIREERKTSPLRLLVIGTHFFPTRVLPVLEALALLRLGGLDARLSVVGRLAWKNAAEEVDAAARKLGISEHLHLAPAFTQAKAPEIYRAHDVLVHAKYKDPCPTVVLEALASGLPVVASATGGLPEMVSEKTGRLIPLPDTWEEMLVPTPDSLASAISEVAAHLEEMTISARISAEQHFSVEGWIGAHSDRFQKLLRRNP